jgi:hypothetical protein
VSDFVAAPPPAPVAVADAIAGDGWWPDLSIAKFRDAVRMPMGITDGRVRDALVNGAISAAVELDDWRKAREAGGIDSLAAVDGPMFGGEKRPVTLWRRAVYSFAAADLADTQNDITATDKGAQRHDVEARSAPDHRRNATVAIRDLQGKTRTKVALL